MVRRTRQKSWVGRYVGVGLFTLLGVLVVSLSWAQEAPPSEGIQVHADHAKYDFANRQADLEGNVTITYQDVTIKGDKAHVDYKRQVATLVGPVTLTMQNQQAVGRDLVYDFSANRYTLKDATSTLQPEFFEEGVQEPIYIYGDSVEGEEGLIVVRNGAFTSCALPRKHWAVKADAVRIIPVRRLATEKGALFIHNRKVARLPGFTVPLDRPRPSYMPEVGRSAVEGYYVKSDYNYSHGERSGGTAYFDVTERQGISAGLEQTYATAGGAGLIYFYNQFARGAFNARLAHDQNLGKTGKANLNSTYVRNSLFAVGTSSSANINLNLSNAGPVANSTLALSNFSTRSPFSSSTNQTTRLQHTARFAPGVTGLATVTYSSFGITNQARNLELLSNFQLQGRRRSADWTITREKRDDPDGDRYTADSGFAYVSRLPEIVMRTDAQRLGILGRTPVGIELMGARITEQRTRNDIWRYGLNLDTSFPTWKMGPRTDFRVSSGLRQRFFQGGAAQYVISSQASLDSNLGGQWRGNLGYSFQDAAGFSPFDVDQVFPYNTVNASFYLSRPNVATASITTAYDFERKFWRDLLFRGAFGKAQYGQLSLASGYSIEDGLFRDLILRHDRLVPDRFRANSSLRYNMARHQLQTLTTNVDWVVSPRWRFEWIAGYSGPRHRLEFNEARLSRTYDCFTLLTMYSQSRKEFRFAVVLNAFAGQQTDFGIGGSGQYLTPSTGVYY